MARLTLHKCDRMDCTTTAEPGPGNDLPTGWIKLHTFTGDKVGTLELCGSYCVAVVGMERVEAETGKPFRRSGPRVGNNAGGKGTAEASAIRWHREGKHDKDPRPGCPLCEEATATT